MLDILTSSILLNEVRLLQCRNLLLYWAACTDASSEVASRHFYAHLWSWCHLLRSYTALCAVALLLCAVRASAAGARRLNAVDDTKGPVGTKMVTTADKKTCPVKEEVIEELNVVWVTLILMLRNIVYMGLSGSWQRQGCRSQSEGAMVFVWFISLLCLSCSLLLEMLTDVLDLQDGCAPCEIMVMATLFISLQVQLRMPPYLQRCVHASTVPRNKIN